MCLLTLRTWSIASYYLRKLENMFGRCTAAATHNIDQPTTQILLDIACKHLRRLVVATHHIRKTRIGVCRHSALAHLGQTLQVRQHLTRTVGTIQTHRQRLGVRHRGIERLDSLSRQRAATRVGQRARDHQRNLRTHLLAKAFNSIDSRLGIKRIEHRFEQQQIHTALNQCARLNFIRCSQLLERYLTRCGVIHIGRNRRRAIGRAHRACHQTRFRGVCRRITIGNLACHLCCRTIQLGHILLQPIVGHRHRIGIETTRRNDVGARAIICVVNLGNHLRARQHQQIVAPLDRRRPLGKTLTTIVLLSQSISLHHRTHTTVQQQYALREQLFDICFTLHSVVT